VVQRSALRGEEQISDSFLKRGQFKGCLMGENFKCEACGVETDNAEEIYHDVKGTDKLYCLDCWDELEENLVWAGVLDD